MGESKAGATAGASALMQFEREVRERFRPAMLAALQERVDEEAARVDAAPSPRCPDCTRAMKSRGRATASSTLTFSGVLRIEARHFRCRSCKRNACPVQDALGVEAGRVGGALARMVAVLTCIVPFEMAASLTAMFFGVELSTMTAWRIAQRLGAAAAEHVESSLPAAAPPAPDATADQAPEVVVLGVDGCALGMQVRKTRRRRRTPDEKLAPLPPVENGQWREVKTGVLLLPEERQQAPSGRRTVLRRIVVTCLGNADRIFLLLHAKLLELGWLGPHTVVVVVGDGAEWIWNRAKAFPNRCEILDFWHALEYAWDFAKAHWGADSPFVLGWIATLSAQLKAGQVDEIIERLSQMPVPAGAEAQRTWRALIKYYTAHASRMRYDEYLRLGYGIGSGAVESAHKQVVHARLRQAGMRWSEAGASRMLALRQLLLNNEWCGTVDGLRMRGDAERLAA